MDQNNLDYVFVTLYNNSLGLQSTVTDYEPAPPTGYRVVKLLVKQHPSIKQIQQEQGKWQEHNFPNNTYVECLMGVCEEVGELNHALLKMRQKIRSGSHELAQDAIGDIVIYLMGLCNRLDYDLEHIVEETWEGVKKRDWIKYPKNGLNE